MTATARLPPRPHNEAGEQRRIGIELELSGLDLETIAQIVAGCFAGDIEIVSNYERLIGTALGEFRVELDYQYLKDLGRGALDDRGFAGEVRRLSEDAMAQVARKLVPMEIVTPPLAPAHFHDLDVLVEELRASGGRGTRHSPIYAFGLHLNPEVPQLQADSLLRYLRAFMCLYDWLVVEEQVDWSRRVTPYINPFPREYLDIVLEEDYRPRMCDLIDDYLLLNADRNRALDMLPLFAHIDEARVRASIDDPRIKPRPTFHYRLPNCDIDIDGWNVSACWANWLAVEGLAEDQARLEAACAAYREYLAKGLGRLSEDWVAMSGAWAT